MSDSIDSIFGSDKTAVSSGDTSAVSPNGQVEFPRSFSSMDGEAKDAEQTTPMTSLACWVMDRYRENSDFRRSSGVDEKLNYCLRAQTCSFSTDQRAELVKYFGKDVCDRIFTPITATKNRAAKAMLIDLINQSGDPLFRIEPSPYPEVPKEVEEEALGNIMNDINEMLMEATQNGQQQITPEIQMYLQNAVQIATTKRVDEIMNAKEEFARERARRMEKKVWDLLEEGNFKSVFKEFIDNVCCKGTGIIIGPVFNVVPVNKCIETKNGIRRYKRVYEPRVCFENVDPMDCYPSPDAKKVEDGVLCIRVKYTADSLYRMSRIEKNEVPDGKGWITSAVKALINRHPRGGVKLYIDQYNPERRYCERNGTEDVNDCTFEGVRCFTSIQGSSLIEMGITSSRLGEKIEADDFYRVEAIVIENRVVYCRIYDDALGVPVSKGTFYSLPNSWWGESIADKLSQCQAMLNNCVISLLKNMSTSSGAIFYISDFQRLVNKSPDAIRLHAGMTVPFNTSPVGNSGAPIGAITVPSVASELLSVFASFVKQADLDSGIPAYSEGQSAGSSGALRTAAGLATLTEASTRGFKMVMTSLDDDVITRIARLTADWVLLYDDDQSLKGDVYIRSVGLIGRVLKAQRDQSRLQLFNLIINNQMLSQMFGPNNILELLRPSIVDVDINPDDVMPSKGKIEEMEEMAKIKQIFEATAQAQAAEQNIAGPAQEEGQEEAAGAQSGIAQPPAIQGGVAERRAVA